MSMFFAIAIGIIIGIILIGFLVFIHEAGHFFAAKFFKVKVEEFGFGYPPRIWGKKKGETIYSINAIPAGGFVRLLGEDEEELKDNRSFAAKGPWLRMAIISAGIAMNLLIAFGLFTVVLVSGGFRVDMPTALPTTGQTLNLSFPFGKQTQGVMIGYVFPGSPAEKAGLKPLDELVSVDGRKFTSIESFQKYINENKGKEIAFNVYNIFDKTSRWITAIPRKKPPTDEGPLGLDLDSVITIRYQSAPEKIFVGPIHSANMLYFQGAAIGSLVSLSFREKSIAPVSESVSGPVGLVGILGQFIGSTGLSGAMVLIDTIALISLVLGVVNLLPIPAADGGRLFFALLEAVFRIKVSERIERAIHTAGFAVLIILFILITYNDIVKFFR